jgi:hypothetical protein
VKTVHPMKYVTYAVPVLILLLSFFYNTNPFILREEARQAFDYLNTVRLQPEQYADSLQLETGLPINRSALRWNDTLARVAEAKALDMARRHYQGAVDPNGYGINYYIQQSGYQLEEAWTANPTNNFFESLQVGSLSGPAAIQSLILDKDFPGFAHRNHLLGIGQWNHTLADIGIGFVKCDVGKHASYTCIIIAKHN